MQICELVGAVLFPSVTASAQVSVLTRAGYLREEIIDMYDLTRSDELRHSRNGFNCVV